MGWDLRNVAVPLFSLNRNVTTNQKISFDLSSSGQWLLSGDTDGILHVFDVEFGTKNGKFPDYQVWSLKSDGSVEYIAIDHFE